MNSAALAERQENVPANVEPHPASDSAALIIAISRAASDPNADIDKMERLMAMHEKMEARAIQRQFDEAFAAMQPNLPEIDKRGKIIIKSKDGENIIQSTPYALWEDTNKLIKPILAEYGFALSFRITQTEAKITTTAVLSHKAGHRETTDFSASIDATGSKNNVQGWGSSFSYGKRYTGTAILNITTKGEDDDGKAAGDPLDTLTEKQVLDLSDLIDSIADLIPATTREKHLKAFLKHMKVQSLGDISAKDYGRAVDAINSTRPQ